MTSGPNLYDVLEEWLPTLGSNYAEWEFRSSVSFTKEFSKLNPMYHGPWHLGTLSGYGWIFTIWEDYIESFAEPVWSPPENKFYPSDPEFFAKLHSAIDAISRRRLFMSKRRYSWP